MTLAEDKRPEANRLIELRPYALQRHERVIIYASGVSVGRRLKSLTQCQIAKLMVRQLIVESY